MDVIIRASRVVRFQRRDSELRLCSFGRCRSCLPEWRAPERPTGDQQRGGTEHRADCKTL